jgi:DNA repair ATPase RecN
MAEEVTVVPPAETTETGKEPESTTEDQHVPYERFKKANTQAKEAKDHAAKLERDLDDLRARLEERETAGLPELERERKRAEQLEKRAADAEKRADAAETTAQNSKRERWITSAASALNFIDPDDAARFVDLADVESAEDAERAVKRVAKAKKHLVKSEDPALPGQLLKDGQRITKAKEDELPPEARALQEGLRQFASKP